MLTVKLALAIARIMATNVPQTVVLEPTVIMAPAPVVAHEVIVTASPRHAITREWVCSAPRSLLATSNEGDWSLDRSSPIPYAARSASTQTVRHCQWLAR